VPSSAPGKLVCTLGAADSGTLVISGTNWGDQAISETLTFAAEAGPKTTTAYFKTVNAGGLVGAAIDDQTLLIMCDRNIYTHTIQVKDALLYGLTIEAVMGGLPSVFIGTMLSSGSLAVSDLVTLSINAIAQRVYDRYKYAASATPTVSDTPTDVSGYTAISDLVYPAWSIEVDFDSSGTPTPVGGMTFNFNNNLGYPTRLSGIRTNPQPVRTANRDISIVVPVDYASDAQQWVHKFLNLDDVIVTLTMSTVESSGALRTTTINMPRTSISAFPSPEASDYSEIMSSLEFRPIRTIGAVAADELTVVVESIEAAI